MKATHLLPALLALIMLGFNSSVALPRELRTLPSQSADQRPAVLNQSPPKDAATPLASVPTPVPVRSGFRDISDQSATESTPTSPLQENFERWYQYLQQRDAVLPKPHHTRTISVKALTNKKQFEKKTVNSPTLIPSAGSVLLQLFKTADIHYDRPYICDSPTADTNGPSSASSNFANEAARASSSMRNDGSVIDTKRIKRSSTRSMSDNDLLKYYLLSERIGTRRSRFSRRKKAMISLVINAA